MDDVKVSLPDVTYSERELLVTTLHKRMMYLEEIINVASVSNQTHFNDELAEVTALYNKFQYHF